MLACVILCFLIFKLIELQKAKIRPSVTSMNVTRYFSKMESPGLLSWYSAEFAER